MSTYLQADTILKELVCKNMVECDKLSKSIRFQIDELEKRGIENLTNKEFDKLILLQDKLLATQDSTIVLQRKKTARQREILIEAKAKTARQREIIAGQREIIVEENKKQAALNSVLEKLDSIQGILKGK